MPDLATATILAALILAASIVSVEFGISVAVIEIGLGVVGASLFGLRPTPWIDFIGSFAGIVLTFLAGAEVDRTLLRREWETGGHTPLTSEIFTCGPHGLLREVADFARAQGVRCEASLEGPMACAVGACRGCPVPLLPGSLSGNGRYPAMCVEGPVMDARIVDWDRLP